MQDRNWGLIIPTNISSVISEFSSIPYYFFGVVVTVVTVVSTIGNFAVCCVYIRHPNLNKSIRRYLIVLATSETLCPLTVYWMSIGSAFEKRWIFGNAGCVIHAFFVGFFGIYSIFLIAAVAVEQGLSVARPHFYRNISKDSPKIQWFVITSCFAGALALSLPPFFGISRFKLEGLNLACSIDFMARDWESRLYMVCLMSFGYFVPLLLIMISYWVLWQTLRDSLLLRNTNSRRDLSTSDPDKRFNPFQHRRNFGRFTLILSIVLVYIMSWTPYAIVAMIGQFAPPGTLSLYSIYASELLAKTFTVYNPVIYGLANNYFRVAFCETFFRDKPCMCCARRTRSQACGEHVQGTRSPLSFEQTVMQPTSKMSLHSSATLLLPVNRSKTYQGMGLTKCFSLVGHNGNSASNLDTDAVAL